jgi:membrane protein involved in colicin uptake
LHVDAVVKWFNNLAFDVYHPFLSEDEINDLIAGKDIWMEAEEIRERLKHMVRVRAEANAIAEQEAAVAEAEAIIAEAKETKRLAAEEKKAQKEAEKKATKKRAPKKKAELKTSGEDK